MKTIEMSNYSVGESCYNEIPGVCEKYNVKKVVLIGGKRALAATEPRIREAIKETDIIITDSIVYGIECTMTNVHKLTSNSNVQEADVIFAIGGAIYESKEEEQKCQAEFERKQRVKRGHLEDDLTPQQRILWDSLHKYRYSDVLTTNIINETKREHDQKMWSWRYNKELKESYIRQQ